MIDRDDFGPAQSAEIVALRALVRELLGRTLTEEALREMIAQAAEEQSTLVDRELTPGQQALAGPAMEAQLRILQQAFDRRPREVGAPGGV